MLPPLGDQVALGPRDPLLIVPAPLVEGPPAPAPRVPREQDLDLPDSGLGRGVSGEVLLQRFFESDGQLPDHQGRLPAARLGLALRQALERGASRHRLVAGCGRQQHAAGVRLQLPLLAEAQPYQQRSETGDRRETVAADLAGRDLVLQLLDAVLQIHMTDLMSEDRRQLGLGLEEVQHTRGDVHGPAGDGEGIDRLRPDDVEAVRDRLAAGAAPARTPHPPPVIPLARVPVPPAPRPALPLTFAVQFAPTPPVALRARPPSP